MFGDETIAATQDDVAAMAGTTRPTANRALKTFADAGEIILGRGRIDVVDLDALRRRAR